MSRIIVRYRGKRIAVGKRPTFVVGGPVVLIAVPRRRKLKAARKGQ